MVWLVAIWTVHTSNKLKWLQFRACQVAFTDWRLGDRISTSSLNLLWTRQYSEQGSSTSKGCFWLAYYVSVMLGSNNDLIWFVAFTFLFYEAVSAGCNSSLNKASESVLLQIEPMYVLLAHSLLHSWKKTALPFSLKTTAGNPVFLIGCRAFCCTNKMRHNSCLQLKSAKLFLDESYHGTLASQLASSPAYKHGK
jgi:hypothetical protein